MTPDQHRRITEVFQQISELPSAERAARLYHLCAGDSELRREVESLLEHHHDRQDGFAESNVGVGRLLVAEPNPSSARLPKHIGRFRIVRRIGEGGMGVVFEAEQDNPRRTVALKVIRAGLASDSVVRRFRHEAEVLGRLQHLGIADVYEAGVAETPLGQQPYFAMQLIQGRSLIDYAEEHRLDVRARLELFARVCDAVQYAHQHGIIHRDLKPANILVDASGQPKILDFGVARVTDGELTMATMQTVTGQMIGTLPYKRPEQISGQSADVDTRSDVYSLGVSLYELLAKRLPYKVANCTLPEAARVIADVEPTHLSAIDRHFRGDVETIVFKALQKDRAQRYQSVAEFAADIRRYLADEPVLARPPSAMYQLRKFALRHMGLVAGVLSVFVSLILGIVGISWFAAGESRQRATAEAASSEARRLAYRVSVGAAADAIEDHSMADARRLLNEAPQELRGWEWRHLNTRLDDSFVQFPGLPPASSPPRVRVDGDVVHQSWHSVSYASIRTGKIIQKIESAGSVKNAVNRDVTMVAAVPTPTRVTLHPLNGGQEMPLPELPNPLSSLCFSNDGKWLAVCDTSGTLHFFDLNDRSRRRTMSLPRPALDMLFSPDDARLAGHDGKGLIIIDVAAGGVRQVTDSAGLLYLVPYRWTTDSELVLCRPEVPQEIRDRVIPVRAASGEQLPPWPGHENREFTAIDLTPDGRAALLAWSDGLMRICEVPSGAVQREFRSEGIALGPAYSPDRTRIAFGEQNGGIRLLDSSTTLTLAVLRGQEAATRSLTFSRDGKTLYSAAEDGVVRAWDLTSAGETSVLRGHSSFVYPVAFSPNGEMLASGSWDQTVRLWDLRSRQERAVLRGHTRAVRSLAFSPDNRKLISITLFGEEEFVWDLATGQYVPLPQRKTGLQNVPEISAFFRDGKRIWLPGDPGTKEKVWNLETGSVETIPLYELRDLSDPRVSPDGRWIARPPGLISIEDPTIRRPYAEGVDRAAFKPDGTQLAGIKHRYPVMPDTIMVWDVASGRELFRLQGHIGEIFDVRFSPDGRRLATSGRDATICIWDAENFEELVLLRGHQDYIWSIDWSPDGRALASGSGDTTVRIWRSEK